MNEGALLVIQGLAKTYRVTRFAKTSVVPALADVSLSLAANKTLALAGRSGSGKSTLARCVARLEAADAGEIWFAGSDLMRLWGRALGPVRRQLQIVFQHSATAINPAFTAIDAVAEPLRIQKIGSRRERYARAEEMMERMGLLRGSGARSSLEFSGGERQRLALARALMLEPKLLILDEALSGLDSTTQHQMVDLLLELQRERRLAYLFITHDLLLAARVAGEIAVMENGRVVERGTAREILAKPQSDAARALVASIPRLSTTNR